MAEEIQNLPFGNEALWAYLQSELDKFRATLTRAVVERIYDDPTERVGAVLAVIGEVE